MKERKRKVRTRTNKMKARVELHQKKIQNKRIEWEQEQNNLEDDVESVPFDPSTVSDIELDEDTIASDLAEEEELGKSKKTRIFFIPIDSVTFSVMIFDRKKNKNLYSLYVLSLSFYF